ncbi:MAG: 3-oxoacyl-[acyl-carrier-protein] reductase [Rhodothermia bacterium]|nr:3-oxoacyl-[acyl-carrier-protein] reductase [Rhodothermia bacterium]
MTVSGKNALVTGGTRGIGRAVVEALSDAGANVAFTFRSSADEAAALASEVEGKGVKALAIQGDAADFEAAGKTIDQVVSEWGSIDILVNNAGITKDGLLLRLKEEDWDAVIGTNLKSVFNYCKSAYRQMMKQRSGKIINMASIVGVSGNAGQTNYAASKAGIIGFSKSLAKELGSRGINVNVVAPGYVETDMTGALSDEAREAMLGSVVLGRPATPQDVANAVLFLASDAAGYITGHVLHVDGGLAM